MASKAEENAKRSFHFPFERVRDLNFYFYFVSTPFDHTASFSSVTFRLKIHTIERDRQKAALALTLGQLFGKELQEQHTDQLKFLKNCRQYAWPPLFLKSESDGLKVANIGLGSVETWHGTPDVRVRESPFVFRKTEESENRDSDTESSASDGATTTIEAKRKFLPSNLLQVISTCVVSSFTEKCLHPELPAVVPTLLMDEKQFQVCLYDCEMDVLLVSNPVELATKGGLSGGGMTILWLVLNHR